MNSYRTIFRKEHNKFIDSKQFDTGTDDLYKPGADPEISFGKREFRYGKFMYKRKSYMQLYINIIPRLIYNNVLHYHVALTKRLNESSFSSYRRLSLTKMKNEIDTVKNSH